MIDKKFDNIQRSISGDTRRKVERAQDYGELFELVKRVVEQEIGQHRAGLTLFLSDMPNTVGAYHPVSSNSIVINRALVNSMRKVARDPREINSFVFMVLLHEYLHSLGYLNEEEVRRMAQNICSRALGEDHYTVKLARANWIELYPELADSSPSGFSKGFEIVRKFDSSSMAYIG